MRKRGRETGEASDIQTHDNISRVDRIANTGDGVEVTEVQGLQWSQVSE